MFSETGLVGWGTPCCERSKHKGQHRRNRYRRAGRAGIRGTRPGARRALGAGIVGPLVGALPEATHCIAGGQARNAKAKSLAPSLKQYFNE